MTISQPIVSFKKSFYTVMAELGPAIKFGCLFLLGIQRKFHYYRLNPKKVSVGCQNPVLLLHGNYHNQSSWLPFAKRVKGFNRPVYTLNLPSGKKTGVKGFLLIHKKITEIQAQYQAIGKTAVKVDLVGHSNGGHLARSIALLDPAFCHSKEAFLKDEHCATLNVNIGKVIMIGEVFNDYGHRPGARFNRSTAFKKRVYQIDGKYDLRTSKKKRMNSIALPQNHCEVATGHIGLLFSRKVHNQILHWLG